jgi:tRNA A58 N-methylase Trm61
MQQQVKQLEDNVNTLKADVKEIKEKESVDRVIRDMEGVA